MAYRRIFEKGLAGPSQLQSNLDLDLCMCYIFLMANRRLTERYGSCFRRHNYGDTQNIFVTVLNSVHYCVCVVTIVMISIIFGTSSTSLLVSNSLHSIVHPSSDRLVKCR